MHALKCTYIVMYIAMYMCHVCLKLLCHACRILIKMTIFVNSQLIMIMVMNQFIMMMWVVATKLCINMKYSMYSQLLLYHLS